MIRALRVYQLRRGAVLRSKKHLFIVDKACERRIEAADECICVSRQSV
jgi:hypothetical protein